MPDFVPAHRYSDAITEIYELRAALAYEARLVEATLDYATFPKGRRAVHTDQVERMRAAARGDRDSYRDSEIRRYWKGELREAGATPGLTNTQWEGQQNYVDPPIDYRAATALLEAQQFASDGFPPAASHIQDRLDVVQAAVDTLRTPRSGEEFG